MKTATIVLTFIVLLGSCGFPQPDRIDPDGAEIDATSIDGETPVDAPVDAPNGIRFTGGITVTGGISRSGTLRLTNDGLEGFDRSCANNLCVTGFLGP